MFIHGGVSYLEVEKAYHVINFSNKIIDKILSNLDFECESGRLWQHYYIMEVLLKIKSIERRYPELETFRYIKSLK